jgi:hypothetical protein
MMNGISSIESISPLQGLMVLYLERWTLSNAKVFRAYSAILPKSIFARRTLVFLAYKIAIPKCIFTQKGYNSPMWNSVQSFINIFPTPLKGLYNLKQDNVLCNINIKSISPVRAKYYMA